jgi:prefoldin subunit 5
MTIIGLNISKMENSIVSGVSVKIEKVFDDHIKVIEDKIKILEESKRNQ